MLKLPAAAKFGAWEQTINEMKGRNKRMKVIGKGDRSANLGQTLATVLVLTLGWAVQGQNLTWNTDYFLVAPAEASYTAQGQALGVSQSGELFNVGYAVPSSGSEVAVLRAQSVSSSGIQDLGFNEFLLPGGSSSLWNFFTAGPAGTTQSLYAGGYASDSQGNHWMIISSTDGGSTWSVFDNFQYVLGGDAHCFGLAADGPATLYAVGSANTTKHGGEVWLTRKGTLGSNGQWSWANLPTFANATARCVAVLPGSPQSTLIVAGTQSGLVQNSYKPTTWITRRSTDGGATWATVDTVPTTRNSYALSTAVDTKGNVTVVGFGGTSTTQGNVWTVRESLDGGQTWTTIDSISTSRAFGVTTVPRTDGLALPDDIYVSGDQSDPNATTWWLVRKLSASLTAQGTIAWTATTLDQYQFAPGYASSADGGLVYIPSSGILCVTGIGSNGTTSGWITRSTVLP